MKSKMKASLHNQHAIHDGLNLSIGFTKILVLKRYAGSLSDHAYFYQSICKLFHQAQSKK